MEGKTFSRILLGLLLGLGSLTAHAQGQNSLNVNGPGQGNPPVATNPVSELARQRGSWTPAQRRLDYALLEALHLNRQGKPSRRRVGQLTVGIQPDARGRVEVDITADVTPALLDAIRAQGGNVVNSFAEYQAIRAQIPLAKAEAIAGLPGVRFVQSKVEARTNRAASSATMARWFGTSLAGGLNLAGSLTSEGDITHLAAAARAAYGLDGTGVKIGVLSDSARYLAASIASGDVPAGTTILDDIVGGSGEGTAMMEIVHDLAPGAQLYFATAFKSKASFAANIKALRDAGCKIIIDDISYFDESPFQDDFLTQAVSDVAASGVHFFSSAGNQGSIAGGQPMVWEGDYVQGVDNGWGPEHTFPSASGRIRVLIGARSTASYFLFWSDPRGVGNVTSDYDLLAYTSATGGAPFYGSSADNIVTGVPYESMTITNYGTSTAAFYIAVPKYSGNARLLHVDAFGNTLFQTATNGRTRGHNAPGDGFGVAAVDVHTTNPFPSAFTGGAANPPEFFTSEGPRRIIFHPDGTPITPGNVSSTGGLVRLKPDFAAADGGVTTVPGFGNFYGTSAAAPHAGAIAALLAQYRPGISRADLRDALSSTALDIALPGWDTRAGAGIVMADRALFALDAAPVASNQSVSTDEDTPRNITLSAVDSDGDSLTYEVISGPSHGILSGTAPNLTYTPNLNYNGPDSFTFKALDSHGKPSNIATVSITVREVNDPPVAKAGDDQTVECAGATTAVTLDGSGSSDVDGDMLSYTWKDADGNVLSTSVKPTLNLGEGTHVLTLTVTDPGGLSDSDTVTVTVQDTTAPVIGPVSATPDVLSPPNHKMATVVVSYSVTDVCDPDPTCWLTVTSNEPDNGLGDGDTEGDIEIVDAHTVRLRAERSGTGTGRVYTITVHCKDASGNVAVVRTATVTVPKNQKK